jgi:hypothetical protein
MRIWIMYNRKEGNTGKPREETKAGAKRVVWIGRKVVMIWQGDAHAKSECAFRCLVIFLAPELAVTVQEAHLCPHHLYNKCRVSDSAVKILPVCIPDIVVTDIWTSLTA